MKTVEIGNIGKIKVTQQLKSQIDYLHSNIHNIEWSGVLLYKLDKGNFKKLKNLEFIANDLFLMDIGSSMYTEIEFSNNIVDMYDNIPEAMELKTGLIHTHHNMQTFFSDTDVSEIQDNVSKYNYYISLIVNNSYDWSCKLAIKTKVKSTTTFIVKNDEGVDITSLIVSEEDAVIIGNLSVEIESLNVKDYFKKQYDNIKSKCFERSNTVTNPYKNNLFNTDNKWVSEKNNDKKQNMVDKNPFIFNSFDYKKDTKAIYDEKQLKYTIELINMYDEKYLDINLLIQRINDDVKFDIDKFKQTFHLRLIKNFKIIYNNNSEWTDLYTHSLENSLDLLYSLKEFEPDSNIAEIIDVIEELLF